MTLDEKRDAILAHEQQFARRIAYEVVGNPKLHVWMILIPVIFVYHFFQLNQAKEARAQFAEGYMQTRRRTLDAVWEHMRTDREPLADNAPDPAILDAVCAESATPEAAMDQYRAFVALLAEHYADLLRASGDTAEELHRSVYRSRSNYLMYLRQLAEVERNLNAALQPHLPEEVEEAQEAVKYMERTTKELRKEQAEQIFA